MSLYILSYLLVNSILCVKILFITLPLYKFPFFTCRLLHNYFRKTPLSHCTFLSISVRSPHPSSSLICNLNLVFLSFLVQHQYSFSLISPSFPSLYIPSPLTQCKHSLLHQSLISPSSGLCSLMPAI